MQIHHLIKLSGVLGSFISIYRVLVEKPPILDILILGLFSLALISIARDIKIRRERRNNVNYSLPPHIHRDGIAIPI